MRPFVLCFKEIKSQTSTRRLFFVRYAFFFYSFPFILNVSGSLQRFLLAQYVANRLDQRSKTPTQSGDDEKDTDAESQKAESDEELWFGDFKTWLSLVNQRCKLPNALRLACHGQSMHSLTFTFAVPAWEQRGMPFWSLSNSRSILPTGGCFQRRSVACPRQLLSIASLLSIKTSR